MLTVVTHSALLYAASACAVFLYFTTNATLRFDEKVDACLLICVFKGPINILTIWPLHWPYTGKNGLLGNFCSTLYYRFIYILCLFYLFVYSWVLSLLTILQFVYMLYHFNVFLVLLKDAIRNNNNNNILTSILPTDLLATERIPVIRRRKTNNGKTEDLWKKKLRMSSWVATIITEGGKLTRTLVNDLQGKCGRTHGIMTSACPK